MNYSEYSFVFDIDGTICPIKKKEEKYEDLVPYASVVEKIRFYHEAGAKIVLFTSRNMNSYGWISGISPMMRFSTVSPGRDIRAFMWMTVP